MRLALAVVCMAAADLSDFAAQVLADLAERLDPWEYHIPHAPFSGGDGDD